MEHVVTIAEIVTMIIRYVHNEDPKDTRSCMLVCKLWSRIALDFIWRVISRENQEDPSVKLRALQSLCNDVSEMADGAGELEAIQNNSRLLERNQTSWNAIAAYSGRVRCLDVVPLNPFDKRVNTLNSLVNDLVNLDMLYPFPLIFPRLQSLRILVLPDRDGSLAYIARYFCDSLQKVVLFIPPLQTPVDGVQPSNPPNYDDTLRELSHISSNIRELNLRGDPMQTREVPERTLLDILLSFQSLETLTLDGGMLSLPVLTSISWLPKLKTLKIDSTFFVSRLWSHLTLMESRMQAVCKVANPDGPLFPSLQVLDACLLTENVTELHSARGLLSQIQGLRVFNPDALSDSSLAELLSDITQTFTNLQALQIRQPYASAPAGGGLSTRPFATLQQLPQLTTLELHSSVASNIFDDDLPNLVKWIPSLTNLRISCKSTRIPNHKFTFKALTVLSHQPNMLRVLELQTNVSLRSNVLCIAGGRNDPGVSLQELEECTFLWHRKRKYQISDEKIADVQEFLGKCLSEGCAKQVLRQIYSRVSV